MRHPAAVLIGALLTLAGPPARRDDDPEPPLPIKVEDISGATVTASTSSAGVVLKIKSNKPRAKKSEGHIIAGCRVRFPEKQAPSRRVTFQFTNHDRLTVFGFNDASYSLGVSIAPDAKRKQVFHFDANRAATTSHQAVLTLTVPAVKDHLEVVVERPNGKPWPRPPWTIRWYGPIKP